MIKTLLLALFSIQSTLTPETPQKDQLKYESTTAAYTIYLPRAWKATADKKIYAQDGQPILLDLWAIEPDKHISLEIIVNHAVAQENQAISSQPDLKKISQFIDNYKVQESKEISIDGLSAIRHIITYTDTIEFVKIQYVVRSNRLIYEITFTMPNSELQQNENYIDQIVKSIRFIKNGK